jgi:hypothetical protein
VDRHEPYLFRQRDNANCPIAILPINPNSNDQPGAQEIWVNPQFQGSKCLPNRRLLKATKDPPITNNHSFLTLLEKKLPHLKG